MRNLDFVEQLRCRLVELGCPRRRMRQLIQEITDHREDLTRAATLKGLSGEEAVIWVNAQLGDPLYLAEHQMILLRRSSWFGRYSLISFFLLPLLMVPVLWALLLALDLYVGYALGFDWDPKKFRVAADNPVVFHQLVLAFHLAGSLAFGLVAFLFCWLARRAAAGRRWMLVACGICTLYALFTWVSISRHNFAIGVSWHPHWLQAAVPGLVGITILALQWRKARDLRKNLIA